MVVTHKEREEWAASRGISLASLGHRRPPEGLDPLAPRPRLVLLICRVCGRKWFRETATTTKKRRYCDGACKQQAYRRRRKAAIAPKLPALVEQVQVNWAAADRASAAARPAPYLSLEQAEAWLAS
jgi:hypothetical protein